VLFASGAITFYEGNNMLSALAKYVINDNEFIPGYSKKLNILDPDSPRKSDVFFVFGKNKLKI
jgi:hypothetical protein